MKNILFWSIFWILVLLTHGCSVLERYEAPYSGAELETSTNEIGNI